MIDTRTAEQLRAAEGKRTRVATVAKLLPGVAAFACTVAGVFLLWGVAWSLLAAVPYLLLLDWRLQ